MIKQTKGRFTADMMKCCHHGSSDVTEEFLEVTEPAAYVVSSGDEESHVHPRPLVLCTETLRSTREREDPRLRGKLDRLLRLIAEETDAANKQQFENERNEILDELFKRNVGVYGAINLSTDGRRAVIAFRKEKPRGVKHWFYYQLERGLNGVFQVASA